MAVAAAMVMGAWLSLAASSSGSVISKGPSSSSSLRDNMSSKKACTDNQYRPEISIP